MASHPGRLNPAAVQIDGLVRSFAGRRVLDGLELTVRDGEFVALLGRSGSGKSTLLRALARLDHDVDGEGGLTAPEDVSVVFQDARLLPWKRLLDNVVLGLRAPDAEERGRAALAEVGLAGRERAWPVELSGGEQQRVSLARSLVREPRLLLADEPFGALDALTRIRMHALLRTLCARHRPAVLLVTHDVDEAIALADRVVVLDRGRIAADLPVDLPAPRRAGAPGHAELRDRLLGHLGVDLTEPGAETDGGADGGPGHGPNHEAAPTASGDGPGRRSGTGDTPAHDRSAEEIPA
ncbi:ABC transporter ATP-binding protein [Streptomyces abyssomicinicus]|uniref:ABC transporter ATP-binding protein n=1 Tax=Streptomyces abyssomicinicus TaxID=574929 RepID=UPI001250CB18|nr:ABC transporter ATP-binding protein [Streptomyces abyssomicinicus]